jgi:putative acetyltransferase
MMQTTEITIRRAKAADVTAITTLFYDTIQTVNAKDYQQKELDEWSASHTATSKWIDRIEEQYFVVAMLGDALVGFASIAADGYLDFMFVHKDHQAQGIATRLLAVLEDKSKEQQNKLIYVNASITAKGFFEHQGFVVQQEQRIKLQTQELVNFRMTKEVHP